jgi:hypothetical protein
MIETISLFKTTSFTNLEEVHAMNLRELEQIYFLY